MERMSGWCLAPPAQNDSSRLFDHEELMTDLEVSVKPEDPGRPRVGEEPLYSCSAIGVDGSVAKAEAAQGMGAMVIFDDRLDVVHEGIAMGRGMGRDRKEGMIATGGYKVRGSHREAAEAIRFEPFNRSGHRVSPHTSPCGHRPRYQE